MVVLLALIKKEWRLLLRDWHALLLLFVMPAAFILVMSLALQNAFARQQGVSIDYYLVNRDGGPASIALVEKLRGLAQFHLVSMDKDTDGLKKRVRHGDAQFLVYIPPRFDSALQEAHPVPLELFAGPDVRPAMDQLFRAVLANVVGKVALKQALANAPCVRKRLARVHVEDLLHSQSLYRSGGAPRHPSAVQQNVPAWLLFAMFFIAIPLSTTWVAERRQGTYARLRGMGLGRAVLFLGKLFPYLAINLIQVGLMLAVGVWLMPLLGAEGLNLGHAPGALCLIALAASFAAVAYGLLIANLASSSEQATIFTGVANLLMAAVGGVMVPRFVMPRAMRMLSHFSPMSWGLDGFLDIFLRHGGLGAVAPEAALLVGFGLLCLAVTSVLPGR